MRLCESEIHDQHLQHQGWAAALANLDDSVFALQKKITSFEVGKIFQVGTCSNLST